MFPRPQVRLVRDDANKMMERGRKEKLIGASMDASLLILVPPEDPLHSTLTSMSTASMSTASAGDNDVDTLRYALMISDVQIVSSADEIAEACGADYSLDAAGTVSGYAMGIRVAKNEGMVKCERCWFFTKDVGGSQGCADDLCVRCDAVVKRKGFMKGLPEA